MLADWLDRHLAQAPAALQERVRARALAAPDAGGTAATLAAAARQTLAEVVAQPGDRSVALDLLAADALITLALLAQAETAPERLVAFATGLLQTARPSQ